MVKSPVIKKAEWSSTHDRKHKFLESDNRNRVCSQIGKMLSNPSKPCSSSFYLCLSEASQMEINCASNLVFDEKSQVCQPRNLVLC